MNLPFEILQKVKHYLGFLDSLPISLSNKWFYQNQNPPLLYLNWKLYNNAFIIRYSNLSYNIPDNLYTLINDYKSIRTIYDIMFENYSIPKHLEVFVHPTPIFNDSQSNRFILPYINRFLRNYQILDNQLIQQVFIIENLLQDHSFYKEIHYLSIDNTPIEIKDWIPQIQSRESLRQRTQVFLKLFIQVLEEQIKQFIFLSDIPKWIKHLQTHLELYYHRQPVFSNPQWIRCSGKTQQKRQCLHKTLFQNTPSIHWYCHQHKPLNIPLLKPSFLIPI
jgi:hypothetical protein